jgi:putative Holliday junction resolvase
MSVKEMPMSGAVTDQDQDMTSEPSATVTGQTMADPAEFLRLLPHGSRLIGIDAGTKTLGLALSDVLRSIASPLETIQRTKFSADAARLLALMAQFRVAGLVLGFPSNLDGTEGPRAQATRALARNLNKLTPVPILLWDERLSTAAAERMLIAADQSRKRRAEVIDKVAATIILQGALDRMGYLARAAASPEDGEA